MRSPDVKPATESTTSCNVRNPANSDAGISGAPGNLACNAARISTCLIESIPSSASISISSPSMSAG